jgi:hypothetical protein
MCTRRVTTSRNHRATGARIRRKKILNGLISEYSQTA